MYGNPAFNTYQKNIDKKDQLGRTPLHYAADRNYISRVEKLLSQGAKVDEKDYFDQTPLFSAALSNVNASHYTVIEILLKHGADPNARDADNRTPLFYLVEKGTRRIVDLLLNFGAEVDAVDNFGKNLLFSVTTGRGYHLEVVKLLIDFGLNVNHSDERGLTPLQNAQNTIYGHIKVIKCLSKKGACINVLDIEHKSSPLHENYEMMVKILKFFVEYTDYNSLKNVRASTFIKYSNVSTLTRVGEKFKWQKIIEHVVKLQSLGCPVHQDILKYICQINTYGDYYRQCEEELLRAKTTKLSNSWITYYHLLVDSRRMLKNYASNRDLIEESERNSFVQKFSIYGSRMDENVKKGMKRRKLYDKSASLLSNCLPIFGPLHLVIRDVLDCVKSKKDLSKFCE